MMDRTREGMEEKGTMSEEQVDQAMFLSGNVRDYSHGIPEK